MAWVQKLSVLDDICKTDKLWQLLIKSTFQTGTENGIQALLTIRIQQESLSGETWGLNQHYWIVKMHLHLLGSFQALPFV